jgi:uncharacterized protein YchJ
MSSPPDLVDPAELVGTQPPDAYSLSCGSGRKYKQCCGE